MCRPGDEDSETVSKQLYGEIRPAVDGATYIVKHMHDKSDYKQVILKSFFMYFSVIHLQIWHYLLTFLINQKPEAYSLSDFPFLNINRKSTTGD